MIRPCAFYTWYFMKETLIFLFFMEVSCMKESDFQKKLIDNINKLFPECVILKNDSRYRQGIPDLIILNKNRWAILECKKRKNSHYQPNQNYYLDKLNNMSYANMVCPENEKEVMDELYKSLEPER